VGAHHADERDDEIEWVLVQAIERVGSLIDQRDDGDASLDDLKKQGLCSEDAIPAQSI